MWRQKGFVLISDVQHGGRDIPLLHHFAVSQFDIDQELARVQNLSLPPHLQINLRIIAAELCFEDSQPSESEQSESIGLRQSRLRPENYAHLSPHAQWEIDKELGILDWDGT